MGRPGVSKVTSPVTPQAASGAGLESPEPKDPPNKKRPGALRSPPPKQRSPTPKEDVKTEAAEAGSASDRKLVDPIGSSSEEEVSERSSSKSREKKKSPSRSPLVRRPHGAKQRKKFARGEYGDRVSFKTPIATVVNDEKKDTATPGQQQAPKDKKGQGKERQKGKGKGFQKGGGKQKGKEKSAKKGGKRKGQKKGKGAWGAGEPRRSGETW